MATNNTINQVPLCAFRATRSVTVGNITGDGTVYVCVYNVVNFDLLGNYNNANGLFIAPYTGDYLFCGSFEIDNMNYNHQLYELSLVTTPATYLLNKVRIEYYWIPSGTHPFCWPFSKKCHLTAGDTACVTVMVSGNTKTLRFYGDATANSFCGYYIAP